ncbi:hypothetical protein [Alteromonas sp. a30]|uniref:hypothetical protein n=1 Tax=Alteromonas sp. a30 TaxID=2730917 RepID=UPI00228033E5|nr:hypothetical protein [Alteromonas sp. a30]MCY7294720.1 hypothetical protein [Alteromonas sp. a30]
MQPKQSSIEPNKVTSNQLGKRQSTMKSLTKLAIAVSALSVANVANAEDVLRKTDDTLITLGTPMTGFNRQLSRPVWDFGGIFGPIGFNFAFGYNSEPGATTPFDLTTESPADTILASGFDPAYSSLFDPPALEDQNRRFMDVGVIVSGDGTRAPVGNVQDGAPWDATRSYPNEDITLGDWMKVRGIMTIKCDDEGGATLNIKARNLVVNGAYTMWGVFERDFSGDGNIDNMAPSALGGAPNIVVPDEKGRGSITRFLNFCPLTEPTLKIVTLAYHSDANVYGAVPELGLLGYPGGTTTHDHISFAVNVVSKVLPEG